MNRNNPRWQIAVGSILGSLAVYAAVALCAGRLEAANAKPAGCSRWKVIVVSESAADVMDKSATMPDGWEPFSMVGYAVAVRQCAN